MIRYSLLSLLLLISACTSNPKIELQPLPIAASEKQPAHVALVIDHEFQNYQFTGPLMAYSENQPIVGLESLKLHYSLGELNADLFKQVANNLFTQVSVFDSWEAMTASGMIFDGILAPSVSTFSAWHQERGNEDVSGITAKLAYKILLYNSNQQKILDWTVTSNQTHCVNAFLDYCGQHAEKEIVLVTRRDIAAQIMTQFPALPEVIAWKKTIADHP